jgi:acetyltransferase-like isoleucine patch superfamily enzyme
MEHRRQFNIKNVKWRLFNFLPWKLKTVIYKLTTLSWWARWRFEKSRVGESVLLDPSVQIAGWKNVSIGANTTISEGCWLNVNFRDNLIDRIIIGRNCHIGRRNFFSAGPLIEIKDYVFTGLDCHFLGCGHNIDSPMIPYIASGLNAGGVIQIGVNCWLATAVTVLQNVKIGHGTVVGARSLVVRELPPFSIAVGNPCKVIKRFDFKNNKWISVKDWKDEFSGYIPDEDEYLKGLLNRYKDLPPSLLASSTRFGWL